MFLRSSQNLIIGAKQAKKPHFARLDICAELMGWQSFFREEAFLDPTFLFGSVRELLKTQQQQKEQLHLMEAFIVSCLALLLRSP